MILVTGAAGFIGYHVCNCLLDCGQKVLGIDNMNEYYTPKLKWDRLNRLRERRAYSAFPPIDLANRNIVEEVFRREQPEYVIHLAAQAGVRYSLENPHAYIDSNIVGFLNVLEGCRHARVKHLVYASSSSVYGANTRLPYSVHQNVDHPISLYAATKKAGELLAHSYSHLYGIPTTGLRFFTVYGPWGRPDMACYKWTKAILEGETIDVYNHGRMSRDFTYIDDIVEGVVRVLAKPPQANPEWNGKDPDPASSRAPYALYNIGNDHPVPLTDLIALIEHHTGQKARCNYLPMQAGDVEETWADVSDLEQAVDFRPCISLEEGMRKFTQWYNWYHEKVGG